jgi:hypothetical protein
MSRLLVMAMSIRARLLRYFAAELVVSLPSWAVAGAHRSRYSHGVMTVSVLQMTPRSSFSAGA